MRVLLASGFDRGRNFSSFCDFEFGSRNGVFVRKALIFRGFLGRKIFSTILRVGLRLSYPLPQNRFQYEKHHVGNADGINAGERFANGQCAQDAHAPCRLVVWANAERCGQSDGLETAPGAAESPGLFGAGSRRSEVVSGGFLIALRMGCCRLP